MATTIGFIDELREDLLDAGWRESLPRGGRRIRGGGRRFSGKRLVAVAAIVGLVAVTGVGLLATGGPEQLARFALRTSGEDRPAGPAEMAPPAPSDRREPAMTSYSEALGGGAAFDVAEQSRGSTSGGHAGAVGSIPLGDLSLIVKTARLGIVVDRDTFDERYQDAMDIAVANQGYVQSSSTQGGRFGSLVIRIPSNRFESTLRELKELAVRVEGEAVSGQDVTAEYVDLQARLRIARARRAVLLRLMDTAVSIEQTLRVQNALDDVQLRIEELQGAINLLDAKVSEATIRLQMRETGVEPLEKDVKNPSIPGAFDRAIAGFFAVVAGTLIGLGYAIPALAIALAAFVAVRVLRRRFAA